MMQGQLIIICGCTGSGKTSIAMREFDKVKNGLVYDFQNHWGNIEYYLDDGSKVEKPGCKLVRSTAELSKTKMRVSPENFNIHDFTHVAKHLKGFTMVVEEATGLFPDGRISQELIQTVLSKRHTGNNFIFVFHAMHRVPPQFIEFINEMYLFNTYDLEGNVKKKFAKIFDRWRHVQAMSETNPHYYERILPPLS